MKLTMFLTIGLTLLVALPSGLRAQFGPLSQPNPSVGESGAATMHGDTASSDATMAEGPNDGPLKGKFLPLFGACPTALVRSDGRPFALCTAWLDRSPVVRILGRDRLAPLAKLRLSKGSLLGGVYAYLDNQDRLVMVDGEQNLIRVKATSKRKLFVKKWRLFIDESVSLADVVTGHCGGGNCDAVVSISPDGDGSVWFASRGGVVGIYQPTTGDIESTFLGVNETIHNSFSTTTDGRAAIATDHALYLLQKDESGFPSVLWRYEYDRGSSRKPGQLSYGTGATPTFFGPTDGTDFVTITDNGDEQMKLLVFDARSDSSHVDEQALEPVCELGVFEPEASGTENSAIGVGNSVFVASTYGYPYPTVPEGAGPSVPKNAEFVGGMARIDVREDQSGCDLVWENDVRSSAVPKFSMTDELIYTVERKSFPGIFDLAGIFDTYHFTVIDPYSGEVLRQKKLGDTVLHDTLQMAGNIGRNGVYWQGTLSGIWRIARSKVY